MLRGGNFAVSDVDVKVVDMPELKIDAKYRKAHSHHRLMEEILQKYCPADGDVPVLITKEHRQVGSFVTIPSWYFTYLLSVLRKSKTQNGNGSGTPDPGGLY